MAKKVVTISISVPIEIDEELQRIQKELNVNSKSALATVLITMSLKWIHKAKEVV